MHSLHASLIDFYAYPEGRKHFIKNGFVIDVLRGDTLVEIQTKNFHVIKPKLETLLDQNPILLVHPIAKEKYIVHIDAATHKQLSYRKSPRQGRFEHTFLELVRIPHLINHPNFALEILLVKEEEIRQNDLRGSWRRGGDSIVDRCLLSIVDSRLLACVEDYRQFIPDNLPQPFTSEDLSKLLAISRNLSSKMIYCLRIMGLITLVGKKGKAKTYANQRN